MKFALSKPCSKQLPEGGAQDEAVMEGGSAEGSRKIRVALLSIVSNTVLVLLKLVVGFLTASVSIISEAAHSAIDLLAAIIAALAVRKASHPPDQDHPFGHGKFENISGFVEALLIFVAAGYIVVESVEKLLVGGDLAHLEAGLLVMGFSAGVNILVSKKLFRVARETDSIALEADAVHLRTDVWTSAGVLAALGAIYLSDFLVTDPEANMRFHALDPLVALGVAAMIVKAAWDITRRSLAGLVDRPLPEDEDEAIREILRRHDTGFVDFHELRHRKAGSERHIDLHLVVASDTTVGEVHALCDHLEAEIQERLPRSKVLSHVEPSADECPTCGVRRACENSSQIEG
jgi:cation diffusion facilitator family transporter